MCVFACVSSRGCIRYTNTTAARSSRCSFWRAFFFALCAVPCCAARLHHGALTGGLPAAAASHDRVCPPCKLSYTIRSLHAGMPCRYGVYFGVLGRDCAEVASGESLRCLLPSLSLQLRAPTRKAYPPNCTCTSTHARTLTHTRAHTSRRMDRYARTRARARAYIKARGQKCTHTCTHAHILQGAWTDIHAHVHTRAHTSRCMDRHARTCAHARTYFKVHGQTCTHMCTRARRPHGVECGQPGSQAREHCQQLRHLQQRAQGFLAPGRPAGVCCVCVCL